MPDPSWAGSAELPSVALFRLRAGNFRFNYILLNLTSSPLLPLVARSVSQVRQCEMIKGLF